MLSWIAIRPFTSIRLAERMPYRTAAFRSNLHASRQSPRPFGLPIRRMQARIGHTFCSTIAAC
ncbi:hypothetical protein RBSWK_04566 [Rhodopirellula baltica SWK14]|uniref:Uncharacterized protein n=1 Tax=Rhodopirellula baltica SWK14 TaxID=993516 RepID=L7CC32_RHOBT|nr:hypothetical protein RBSWK_04566 [Rhodopirellula baltica SWK14]